MKLSTCQNFVKKFLILKINVVVAVKWLRYLDASGRQDANVVITAVIKEYQQMRYFDDYWENSCGYIISDSTLLTLDIIIIKL